MKNPFDEILEDEDTKNKTENISNTAASLYTHKPFYLRWYKFKNASVAISYLCQCISPLTCFAVFFFLFLGPLNFVGSPFSFILSAIISICLAVGIEVLKRLSTTNALIEWFNYRNLNLGFGLAICCSLVSIGTSFWGSYILPSKLTTAPIVSAPILQNVEHLKTSLLASVVSKKQTIEAKTQIKISIIKPLNKCVCSREAF